MDNSIVRIACHNGLVGNMRLYTQLHRHWNRRLLQSGREKWQAGYVDGNIIVCRIYNDVHTQTHIPQPFPHNLRCNNAAWPRYNFHCDGHQGFTLMDLSRFNQNTACRIHEVCHSTDAVGIHRPQRVQDKQQRGLPESCRHNTPANDHNHGPERDR